MRIQFALHIIGVILWMGALMIVSRQAAMLARKGAGSPEAFEVLERTWTMFGLAGLGLALVSGLYQLLAMGFGYYFSQGWFHAKVTLLLLLFVASWLLSTELAAARKSGAPRAAKFSAVHGIAGLSLLLIPLIMYGMRG